METEAAPVTETQPPLEPQPVQETDVVVTPPSPPPQAREPPESPKPPSPQPHSTRERPPEPGEVSFKTREVKPESREYSFTQKHSESKTSRDYQTTGGGGVGGAPYYIDRDEIYSTLPHKSFVESVYSGMYPSSVHQNIYSHPLIAQNRPDESVNTQKLSSRSRYVMRSGYDLGFTSPQLRRMYEVNVAFN